MNPLTTMHMAVPNSNTRPIGVCVYSGDPYLLNGDIFFMKYGAVLEIFIRFQPVDSFDKISDVLQRHTLTPEGNMVDFTQFK